MTSDYQSGASAMREMAAAISENMAKTLRNGGAINAVREYAASVRTLPLPADPASSEGTDAREDWLYLDGLKHRLSDAFAQRDQALDASC